MVEQSEPSVVVGYYQARAFNAGKHEDEVDEFVRN